MSGSVINKATKLSHEVKPVRQSGVDLKNGKVHFKQKCISFEKQSETLQEIVQFREMLEDRIERQASPLTVIPEEHLPLVAKLAHESDKTLSALSKHIRHELLPTQDDEDHDSSSTTDLPLTLSAVETAIKAIMQRNNYGLDGIDGGKPPAAVCVWRWEVNDQHLDWLPKNAREKAEIRLAERIQAKKDLLDIFESLPQNERNAILGPKASNKSPSKEINQSHSITPIDLTGEDKGLTSSMERQKHVGNENDTSKKVSGTIGSTDPEKALKEQEKLEKKAAKAEKEKKARDAQDKSRSLMANFFAKPNKSTRAPEPHAAGPSNIQSDFEKYFKPFVLKKDTKLASINWFLESKKREGNLSLVKLDNEVIVIEDEERTTEETANPEKSELDVSGLTTKEHLCSVISSLPPSAGLHYRLPYKRDPQLKTYSPLSVRDIISKLSEAEIAGDISLVRSLLSQLNNRSLLPAKVLIFNEDARPGYFGTWTRSSRIIGPRTPFTKDVLVFDYGYDSGEEWEDETVGDADDVIDDGEDEDVDAEDADSDMESWLVDDEEEPGISLDDLEISPPLISNSSSLTTKRKVEEGEKKPSKKRKVVTPLVPFIKGPCWDTSIRHCEYDLFEPYRIQMFNDTPLPINPFTFISNGVDDSPGHTLSANGAFAVPNLPDRLINSSLSTADPSVSTGPKKPTTTPKTAFPNVHLPLLLAKITTLQAGSINFLVEAIHRDLREYKVKKNTIEAKVREVGEKCKEKKFWIVKSGVQAPS